MTEAAQQLLLWVDAHAGWAQFILFAAAMVDAMFLIGALVPAGLVLFVMGALVALGTLELWPTILIAAAGAFCGDCFSFWLGHRYHNRLFEWRLFRRFPDAIHNGRRFFARHGGKGVFFGRFLGPMRAVLPSLAGAADMRLGLFLAVDLAAALVWSLAFVLPGAVFGASLGLAAEVAGRLAILLVLLLVLVWGSVWLTLFTIRLLQGHTESWLCALLDWSRKHRNLGNFGAALADPDHPETPVLAVVAVILITLGGLAFYLVAAPALHPYPMPVDAALFQAMRDLHTPWGVAIAEALLKLGNWRVYVPLAAMAFVTLVLARKPRAAAHWAAAVAFGAAISLGVYAIPTLPPPFAFFGTGEPLRGPGRDLVLAAVIYAFVPVLVTGGRSLTVRTILYGSSMAVLLLIVLARLYLGLQWFSLALCSLLVGVLWAAVLGMGYRRHHPESIPARGFVLPLLVTLVAAAALQWPAPAGNAAQQAVRAPATMSDAEWRRGGYRRLSAHRQDISGRQKQPLDIQWAASLPLIEARLQAAGWEPVAQADPMTALRWLSAHTDIAELPVLPQVHAGEHQALLMRYPIDEHRQLLFSLWTSRFQLEDGPPLWIGNISIQRARTIYRFLRYPVSEGPTPDVVQQLSPLADVVQMRAGDIWLLRS